VLLGAGIDFIKVKSSEPNKLLCLSCLSPGFFNKEKNISEGQAVLVIPLLINFKSGTNIQPDRGSSGI